MIERLIGAGGMGQVYLARDEVLLRPVAIKLLHPSVGEQLRAEARVRREARHLSRLQHPNVVVVFEFGREESGACWFAMEFVEGEPLNARLRGRRPSEGEALHVIEQTADALDAAHRLGVVHRDIKPENLLLGEVSGDAWFVKITDFGIAQQAAADDEDPDSLLHMAVGTVPYMAPEQLRAEPLDGRADVYALGVLTYELLTGHHPFERHTGMSMISAHLHEPPPRASALAEGALPAAVDAVLLQALAKRREDRFDTAGDLSSALRAALERGEEQPSRAEPVPTEDESEDDWQPLGVVAGRVSLRLDAGRALYRGEESELVDLAVRRVVQRLAEYGGRLVAWAGGEFLATVAAGPLREDTTVAAIDAALATRAALVRLGTEPILDAPVTAEVALGVDVGLVLRGQGFGAAPILSGRPVARAMELCRDAAEGSVDVDLRSFRTVAGHYASSGGSDSGCHHVEARATTRAASSRRLAPNPDEAPLQGRVIELAQLERSARLAYERHCLQVAVVTGPAGVGKSRLIRESLFRLSEDGVALHVDGSSCSPGGVGGAWEPVAQVLSARCGGQVTAVGLQALLAEAGDAAPTASAAVLARVAGAEADGRRGEAAQAGSAGDRAAAVAAFCGLLVGPPGEQLSVFVVEDAHWASAETWLTLQTMAEKLVDRPLLVVLEMRSDGAMPDLRLPLDQITVVRLAALSDREVDALAASLIPELDVVPEAVLSTIRGAAAGLAVHVEELVAALRSQGDMAGDSTGASTPLSTIDETVLSRIDALDDTQRLIMRRHAVLGEEPPPELLLADQAEGAAPSLGRLRAAGLLTQRRGRGGGVTTGFRHGLVREVVYRNLGPSWRRAEHGRAADWYLDQPEPDAFAEELLWHCVHAGRHDEAARAAVVAARRALATLATDRALELLGAAVDAAHASDPLELAAVPLREAYLTAARISAFQRRPAEASEWLRRAGTDDVAAASHAFLGHVSVARAVSAELEGRFDDALFHVDDAEQLVAAADGEVDDEVRAVLVELWARRAMVLARTQRREEATRAARTAIAHGEALGTRSGPEVAAALGTAHTALGRAAASETGRLGEALGHHRRARDAWRQAGYPVGEAVALLHLGNASWRAGDMEAAGSCWREAQERYLAAGALRGVALVSTNLGELELERGDASEALAQLEQARATLATLGVKDALVEATRLVAEAHKALGDLDAAVQAAAQAAKLAQAVQRPDYAGAAWMTLGSVLRLRGEESAAGKAFGRAVDAFGAAQAPEAAARAARAAAACR